MSVPSLSGLADGLQGLARFLTAKLAHIFLSPGGTFSLGSLLTALCIALLYLGWKHRARTRPLRPRVLLRAIFPRSMIASASTRADIGFFLFNTFMAGLLFGWAILSGHAVSRMVGGALSGAFGTPAPSSLPEWACMAMLTFAAFLAYEFGYWLDHYLSHRVPILWEFHKVHHQAEVLTPLTNFRVHPVDSIVFMNILAITMGSTAGVAAWLYGKPLGAFTLFGSNAIVLIFTYLLDHLHHTQFWIPFTGVWGRIFISPAHHQIHHSTNPVHFDKNMGSCLAVFDWLFGTLHVPAGEREKLTFCIAPRAENPHSLTEGLIAPVIRAAGHMGLAPAPTATSAAPPSP